MAESFEDSRLTHTVQETSKHNHGRKKALSQFCEHIVNWANMKVDAFVLAINLYFLVLCILVPYHKAVVDRVKNKSSLLAIEA